MASGLKIPEALKTARDGGSLSLFIGSGFSIPFGYPTWGELLRAIAEDKSVDLPCSESLDYDGPLQVAEVLHRGYVTKNWDKTKADLKAAGERHTPGPVHRESDSRFKRLCARKVKPVRPVDKPEGERLSNIARVNAKCILTTNYDQCIEQSLTKAGAPFTVLCRGRDCPASRGRDHLHLVKLHGDTSWPDTMVLTAWDYQRFVHRDCEYGSLLYDTFRDTTVLSLGYGFRDMNVQLAYFRFWLDYWPPYGTKGKSRKRIYMLVDREHERKKRGCYYKHWLDYLRNVCVRPVELEGDEKIGSFFEKLAC